MIQWCWALLVLEGPWHVLGARGTNTDACVTMCGRSEDGRCVYWPTSTSKADVAELYCQNCTISDGGCHGPLCGEMCRLTDGSCAYHPSLSSQPNVEELYCYSCPYCGLDDKLKYSSTRRLETDGRLVHELEVLKAQTDKRLATELGKLQQSANASAEESQALDRSTAAERAAKSMDSQLDGSVVGLIANQGVKEAQLEVANMKREAVQLASDTWGAEQHLFSTDRVLIDTTGDAEQAAADANRAASSERRAQIHAHQGHVLEDAAKLESMAVESSRVDKAVQEANMKTKQVESLAAQTSDAARRMAEEARKSQALKSTSKQVADIEETIASLAGQETDAVQTALELSQRQGAALAKVANVEETMQSVKQVADHAGIMASQAQQDTRDALQRAAIEAGVATNAGQALSDVRVSQGIHHLQNKADTKLDEVTQALAKEKEALNSADDIDSASDLADQAAAQASLHAKQAAVDTAKSLSASLKKKLPSPPELQELPVETVQQVLQGLPPMPKELPQLPNVLAFGFPQ